jgi:hypothetical protein
MRFEPTTRVPTNHVNVVNAARNRVRTVKLALTLELQL